MPHGLQFNTTTTLRVDNIIPVQSVLLLAFLAGPNEFVANVLVKRMVSPKQWVSSPFFLLDNLDLWQEFSLSVSRATNHLAQAQLDDTSKYVWSWIPTRSQGDHPWCPNMVVPTSPLLGAPKKCNMIPQNTTNCRGNTACLSGSNCFALHPHQWRRSRINHHSSYKFNCCQFTIKHWGGLPIWIYRIICRS